MRKFGRWNNNFRVRVHKKVCKKMREKKEEEREDDMVYF